MRGADNGPPEMIAALSAFWVGLLYNADALEAAYDLVRPWTAADREALRAAVPRQALGAEIQGQPLRDVALEVLAIARAGLAKRAMLDASGRDETRFLDPILRIAESGQSHAELLLQRFNGPWGGSTEPAFEEFAF
jgi:glutamate--cysteine ligase